MTTDLRCLTAFLAHAGAPAVVTRAAAHTSTLLEQLRYHGVTDKQIQRCIDIAQHARRPAVPWLDALLCVAQRTGAIDAWLKDRAKAWGVK